MNATKQAIIDKANELIDLLQAAGYDLSFTDTDQGIRTFDASIDIDVHTRQPDRIKIHRVTNGFEDSGFEIIGKRVKK